MWVRLDDGFPDHPKVVRAGPEAAWLFVQAACWCARHMTDGDVPREIFERYGSDELLERLVTVGLVDRADEGYRLHDWLDWNISKDGYAELREKRRAAGRRGAEARWSAREMASAMPSAKARDVANQCEPDARTRTRPEGGVGGGRGSRIPIPFRLTDEMLAFARPLSVNIEKETEKFVDYWKAQPGQKGVKLDWPATWRNWMRRASER